MRTYATVGVVGRGGKCILPECNLSISGLYLVSEKKEMWFLNHFRGRWIILASINYTFFSFLSWNILQRYPERCPFVITRNGFVP